MKFEKTYIIAEAGVNHNGNIELAEELIISASKIGADAIKFQTFQTNKIVHPSAPQAEYQQKNCGDNTQHQLLRQLELSREQFIYLKKMADQYQIEFLSTPFDIQSLEFLFTLDLPYIKISSGDITYGPLLLKAAQAGKKVFLSTGMATLEEVRDALYVLAYGYMHPETMPQSFSEIVNYSCSMDWRFILQDKVVLFHCTSEYPAPYSEINLNVLDTFRNEFGLILGYSDHSLGLLVPNLAVAKGVQVIEKHFTLDNNLPGPDHKASLSVNEFAKMIEQIRLVETLLGDPQKMPTVSEHKNRTLVRRGIYTANSVAKQQAISEEHLICLRPTTHVSPMKYWDIIGGLATQDFNRLDVFND